jgi:CrcB protein
VNNEMDKTLDDNNPSGGLGVTNDNFPINYSNIDEVAAAPPENNPLEDYVRARTLEDAGSKQSKSNSKSRSSDGRRPSIGRSLSCVSQASSRKARSTRRLSQGAASYNFPDNYVHLAELATLSPVENPHETSIYTHKSLEEAKDEEQEYRKRQEAERKDLGVGEKQGQGDENQQDQKVSRFATQLYTISYLIMFSFLGTLARLGLQAITFYPGTPVVFSELWANFGGSLVMGFLSEDRMLFRQEWGTPTYDQQLQKAQRQDQDEESGSGPKRTVDLQAAKKAHTAVKKTIPLYIGMTTGFCGCFTSFSSFIRDAFLAMSNDLPTPLDHPVDYGHFESSASSTVPRNGGYSFMALLGVLIISVTLSISGLHLGAHIAIASEPSIPSLPFNFCRKVLDRISMAFAWGCWLGAIFLAIFPPDRNDGHSEIWRGRAVFALVFAPLGCLGRFYASIYLNGRIASFPVGTFVVNILGTAILGMAYDLQHVPLGGVVGCQVLQGIEDGFCGCLTTVSTWVSELNSLRRRNAYRYGAVSVIVALCFLIVIMGSMQWTRGFSALQCTK